MDRAILQVYGKGIYHFNRFRGGQEMAEDAETISESYDQALANVKRRYPPNDRFELDWFKPFDEKQGV